MSAREIVRPLTVDAAMAVMLFSGVAWQVAAF
jgi:hypothetical protein